MGGEKARREEGERDLAFSLAVFVVALLPRLAVALVFAREPVWDGHYYDFGARRIAAGLGYSADEVVRGVLRWNPWCHYPVGYSAFLGAVYKVFGSGPRVAPVANAVTGALLAAVTHRLARHVAGPSRARVAGLLVALFPGLVVYAALLMTEPLAALGVMTAGWLMARDARARPFRGALLAGLLLGLTALVRPPSLLCAPALALFVLGRGEAPLPARLRRGAAVAALGSLAALAGIAPWTARNCRVMDGCALVSTNAGWNLAIGAFPRATGRFETLKASDGCPVVTGQVQQDRCWLRAGLGWIAEDPVRWLGLVPKKLSNTFDHESFPMGYLGEADPEAWPEPRKAAGRAILSTAFRALLVAAALGLVAFPRSSGRGALAQLACLLAVLALAAHGFTSDFHPFWPLALAIPLLAFLPVPGAPPRPPALLYLAFLVLSVAATHAVFFGEDRYHVVATPALCVLAACALRRPRSGS